MEWNPGRPETIDDTFYQLAHIVHSVCTSEKILAADQNPSEMYQDAQWPTSTRLPTISSCNLASRHIYMGSAKGIVKIHLNQFLEK